MLSIPDMALLGAAALMFFGPEQLPKVARKVGLLVRDVQNTSQTFIREMERAADEHDSGPEMTRGHLLEEPAAAYTPPYTPPVHDAAIYGAYDGGYVASPAAHDLPAAEATSLDAHDPPPSPGHQPAP